MPCPDSCADAATRAESFRLAPPKTEPPLAFVPSSLSPHERADAGVVGGDTRRGITIVVPALVDVDAAFDVIFEVAQGYVCGEDDVVSLHKVDAAGELAGDWSVRDRWYRVTHERLRHGIAWETSCAAPSTGLYQVRYTRGNEARGVVIARSNTFLARRLVVSGLASDGSHLFIGNESGICKVRCAVIAGARARGSVAAGSPVTRLE